MHILGIETSCDETSAAVVKDGWKVLSNVTVSSLKEHARFGGIIPEIASRRQMECISAVVKEALKKAGVSFRQIGGIAVTQSPGLVGSLLVGLSYARALAFAVKKPLVEVDHIHAHIYANFLNKKKSEQPRLPAVGLVVSGGHTSLYKVTAGLKFRLLGTTRDDAAGEAFDKVARIMDLGYPGGPVIDRLAKTGANERVRFKGADLPGTYDFSFSGIKTAVLYHRRANPEQPAEHVAYAFQKSVVGTLIGKAVTACEKTGISTLLVGGGVAANSGLRTGLSAAAGEKNLAVFYPPMEFCLDNAAMIAGYGFHLLKKRRGACTH